jgi:hypothetical protein
MENNLQRALDLAQAVGRKPDLSEGMAEVFEDTPESKPILICSAVFAREVCESDSLYVWRKL